MLVIKLNIVHATRQQPLKKKKNKTKNKRNLELGFISVLKVRGSRNWQFGIKTLFQS